MRGETTLFYDVDTQRDFVLPGGRLFIPGTDRITPQLAALTRLGRRLKIPIVASTDRHFPGDRELQRNGGEFPDHCMDGTPGQKKIDATAPLNPVFIENRDLAAAEMATALAHRGEIVLEKQLFDVFAGNRNTQRLLTEFLAPIHDVVLYGVYTEVCLRDAVNGLLQMGPRLHVVTDAIADIGAEGEHHRRRWKHAGVSLLTLAELTHRLR
jgi:nicotinamidase/pyrazinamidase